MASNISSSADYPGVLPYGPTMISATSVLVTICITLLSIIMKKSSCHPPGPVSFPILGDLPWLGCIPHEGLQRLRRRYGDIYRLQMGTLPVVVLCSLRSVKAALVDRAEVFAGRPQLFTFQYTSEGKTMCFNSYSPQWKLHRRLAERALKMASVGFMDNIVKREADLLCEDFLSNPPINPMSRLLWAVAHVKYTLCYGDSREAGEDFTRMIQQTNKMLECHNNGNLFNFFPWTRYVMRKSFRELKDIFTNLLTLSSNKVNEHITSYQSGRIRDALDAFIELGLEKNCCLEDKRILYTVQEFLVAGLDIVCCSLAWSILYLAQYPHIQTRLREDLLDVIEEGECPAIKHKDHLPYWQAFIQEVLRHSSVIPFALPHSTINDTELDGMTIEKDTFILVNLFSISRDPDLWDDPDDFNPERFLDGKNIDKKAMNKYIPFSMGKRKCVGEHFSKNEIFLFLATLLHTTNIQKDPEMTSYDLEPEFGVIFKPKPYRVCFERR